MPTDAWDPGDLRALEAVSSPLWSVGAREGSRPNYTPRTEFPSAKGSDPETRVHIREPSEGPETQGVEGARKLTDTRAKVFVCVLI